MEPADTQITQLADAVARGRITLAEVAGIDPTELDTLFELACARLDTGRDGDAAQMLAGLVTLFPFRAKYWRAYGIALHRLLQLERAKAAYDAAWLLDPGSLVTLCYRGEVLLYLKQADAARQDLETVAAGSRHDLARRATDLLKLLEMPHWRPPQPAPTPPRRQPVDQAGVGFTLRDGRSLPLDEGRFSRPEAPVEEDDAAEDTMVRTRAFARPVKTSDGAEIELAADHDRSDITETAIVRRRKTPRDLAQRGQRRAEGTDTAVVPPRRRPAAPSVRPPSRRHTEITHTAVVLRREGLSLLDGFGAADDPTAPGTALGWPKDAAGDEADRVDADATRDPSEEWEE